MAKSFFSYFAIYDGIIRCQSCMCEQSAYALDNHEFDCSTAEEAIQWWNEAKAKLEKTS
jgi:hypothetical protein